MPEPMSVAGTLDSLGPIGKFVMTAANEAGLEKKTAYRLRLAVDEIVTNIIVHGYDEAGLSGEVKIWSDLDDRALTIWTEDTAVEFDPRNAPDPDMESELHQRPEGGLGVFLATIGVDEFDYVRVGDRNRNRFTVYRSS